MPHQGESAPDKLEESLPEKESPKRGGIVSFGPFRLRTTERLLEKDGVPLNLDSRALDLLITLIERAPQLVSKGVAIDYEPCAAEAQARPP
jgi:DNA-binding response OmpR family regulator